MISTVKIVSNALQYLLTSAENRNSSQGQLVYRAFAAELAETKTEDNANELLRKLNATLTSIEAHGEFSDDEYAVVMKLRELEVSNAK